MRTLGIVFDLDNTLVQSKIDFRSMAGALVEYLRERVGTHTVSLELAQKPIAQIVESARSLSPDVDLSDDLWRIVALHESKGMEHLQLEPAAPDVIDALVADGHRVAICTNNARPATLEALKPFGTPTPFCPIITRDEVHALKPSAEGLRKIVCGWTADGVRELVMVGDSWLDGKAAADAGVAFVEYRGRPGRVPREPIPVWHRIEHLTELLGIIAHRESDELVPKDYA